MGVFYAPQIGRRGIVQAIPRGFSRRRRPFESGHRPIVCGGEFGDLCRTRGIKQEFTTADSPQFNGVAERALGLIETAAMTGRIQARELYPCLLYTSPSPRDRG